MKLKPKHLEHDWVDVTTVGDDMRRFVCSGCSAKMEEPFTNDDEEPEAHPSAKEWTLELGLSDRYGQYISWYEAQGLLDMIVNWAEARRLHVGGGIKPVEES